MIFCYLTVGAVVALEFNGDGVVEACRNIANDVFSGTKVTFENTLCICFYWLKLNLWIYDFFLKDFNCCEWFCSVC